MEKKPLSLQVDLDQFIPATEEEKEYMVQMRESSTFFRDGVKRLVKNKVAFVSFIVIVLITLSSIFVPMFWPYSYENQLGVTPGKPFRTHRFDVRHDKCPLCNGTGRHERWTPATPPLSRPTESSTTHARASTTRNSRLCMSSRTKLPTSASRLPRNSSAPNSPTSPRLTPSSRKNSK